MIIPTPKSVLKNVVWYNIRKNNYNINSIAGKLDRLFYNNKLVPLSININIIEYFNGYLNGGVLDD